MVTSRAPRGARGLKLFGHYCAACREGRAPRGARGLKRQVADQVDNHAGRAPRGARGLKHECVADPGDGGSSRPTRGAWIETWIIVCTSVRFSVAPHAGRVD